jgi:hypothetical protein
MTGLDAARLSLSKLRSHDFPLIKTREILRWPGCSGFPALA